MRLTALIMTCKYYSTLNHDNASNVLFAAGPSVKGMTQLYLSFGWNT